MKKSDDELLVDRVYDLIAQSATRHKPKFTHFLNERECYIAEKIAKDYNCMFFGGYDNAKRKILGVFSEFSEIDKNIFPFDCIRIDYRKQDTISHRDILGSLMGLQIERHCIGDIIVNEGFSYVFAESSVAEHILNEITKVGRVGVKLSIENEPIIEVKDNFVDLHGTVSSFRADAIVAFAANLSRSKAQSLIASKGIMLNYEEIHDINKQMREGDIFSIQGIGKYLFAEVGKNTRSGRIHILLKKYQ